MMALFPKLRGRPSLDSQWRGNPACVQNSTDFQNILPKFSSAGLQLILILGRRVIQSMRRIHKASKVVLPIYTHGVKSITDSQLKSVVGTVPYDNAWKPCFYKSCNPRCFTKHYGCPISGQRYPVIPKIGVAESPARRAFINCFGNNWWCCLL